MTDDRYVVLSNGQLVPADEAEAMEACLQKKWEEDYRELEEGRRLGRLAADTAIKRLALLTLLACATVAPFIFYALHQSHHGAH